MKTKTIIIIISIFYAFTYIDAQNIKYLEGTIHGEFSVSGLGAANYQIPITVPPGIRNIAPQVSLVYDSNMGNGIAGWGWDIGGISVISRTPRSIYYDGTAKGIQNISNDAYALDGKRLIHMSGTEGSSEAIYKFETEDFSSVKIINSGPGYFELTSQDGTIYRYGSKANSKITTTATPTVTISWYLDYIQDVNGNYISYEYTRDVANSSTYLKKISYGSNINKETTELNTVEFLYEDRFDTINIHFYKQIGSIKKILKNIVSKINGNTYRDYQLEYEKDDYANRLIKVTEIGHNGEAYYPTNISWDIPKKTSLKTSGITMPSVPWLTTYNEMSYFSTDIDGDGLSDIIGVYQAEEPAGTGSRLKAYAQVYTAKMDNSGNLKFIEDYNYGIPISVELKELLTKNVSVKSAIEGSLSMNVGVIDGVKGNALVLTYYDYDPVNGPDMPVLFINSTGVATFRIKIKGKEQPGHAIIDVNNDGVDDFFYIEKQKNNSVYEGEIISSPLSKYVDRIRIQFNLPSKPLKIKVADFNGDGLQDILALLESSYVIYYNQGKEANYFSDSNKSTNNTAFNGKYYTAEMGDFNGDGLPDLLLKENYNSAYKLATNNGTGFSITNIPEVSIPTGSKDDKYNVTLVYDFDNDGKSDIVLSSYTSSITNKKWYRSTGKNFELIKFNQINNESDAAACGKNFILGDFDGDGFVDLINYGQKSYDYSSNSIRGNNSWNFYKVESNNNLGRVRNITNGYGQRIHLEYSTISNRSTYTQHNNAQYPIIDINNLPIRLVSRTFTTSKLNDPDNEKIMTYKYSGLKASLQKGVLGFSEINQEDNTENKSITYLDINTDFLYPLIVKTETFRADELIGQTDFVNKVQVIDQTKKRFFSYIEKKTDVDRINNNNTTSYFENYQYGKPKKVTIDYGNGLKDETLNEYNVKGFPTSISKIKYNNTESWTDKTTIMYDKNNIKERIEYTNGVKKILTDKYEYDIFGNNIIHSQSKFDSKDVFTHIYQYSIDGKYLENEVSYDDKKTEYTYDKMRGLLASVYKHNSDEKIIYTYDAMGRVIKETDKNNNVLNSIQRVFYPNNTTTKWEYLDEFDENYTYTPNPNKPSQTFSHIKTLALTEGQTVGYDFQPSVNDIGNQRVVCKLQIGYWINEGRDFEIVKNVDPTTEPLDDSFFTAPFSTTYEFLFIITIHYDSNSSPFSDVNLRGYISKKRDSQEWNIVSSITKSGINIPTHQIFYDYLGQEIITKQSRFDGSIITTEKVYDKEGKIIKESLPYNGETPSKWNKYEYDTYGRMKKIINASGNTVIYTYSPNSVTETKDNIAITRKTNAAGQLIEVSDPAGITKYKYRADGQISEISTIGDIKTIFSYDDYGRQISINDPSAGVISKTFDDKGNIKSTTDANGKVVTMEYDMWNKITKKVVDNITSFYNYDERDNLLSIISDNGISKKYVYRRDNLLLNKVEIVDGYEFKETYTYTPTYYLSSITYASKNGTIATENYTYNNGYLTDVRLNTGEIIFSLKSEDDFGNPTKITTGNLTRVYNFDVYGYPTLRETYIGNTTTWQNRIWQDIYQFNTKSGNLIRRADNGVLIEENFAYDPMNRLYKVSFGGESDPMYNFTISYDNKGNITNHSLIGNMEYKSSKPYAVSGLNLYDTESLYKNSFEKIEYNSLNRPTLIETSQYSSIFKYDDVGNRVKMNIYKIDSDKKNNHLEKIYFSDKYEIENSANAYFSEWVFLHGNAYTAPAIYAKKNGSWDVYYIIRDFLGSVNQIVSKNGVILQDLRYNAWGRVGEYGREYYLYPIGEEPKLLIGRGYTGHEHLQEYGLINMNARLYDPVIGRFLSPDPYVQMPDFSQNFNRYSYALNNPLRYTDPNGEFFISYMTGFLGGLFSKKPWQAFDQGWRNVKNEAKIHWGFFRVDLTRGSFWRRSGEILSRVTWQSPQTGIGYLLSLWGNNLNLVNDVGHYGGSTVVQWKSSSVFSGGAVTLGSFINGQRSIEASPHNSLFQHEFGHYKQSQKYGLSYLSKFGIPSIFSAGGDGIHNNHPVEQDANARALSYFVKKYGEDFASKSISGKKGWDFVKNNILGYDQYISYSHDINKAAIKNASIRTHDLDLGIQISTFMLSSTPLMHFLAGLVYKNKY